MANQTHIFHPAELAYTIRMFEKHKDDQYWEQSRRNIRPHFNAPGEKK